MGLYTAPIEGEPAGEGAGVGGGAARLGIRFSPALPDGPALSSGPALICPITGLFRSIPPRMGELGAEDPPRVRVLWEYKAVFVVLKATVLLPVRSWGMPGRGVLRVPLDCSWLAAPV